MWFRENGKNQFVIGWLWEHLHLLYRNITKRSITGIAGNKGPKLVCMDCRSVMDLVDRFLEIETILPVGRFDDIFFRLILRIKS